MCFKKFYLEQCILKINIKIESFNYFAQFKKDWIHTFANSSGAKTFGEWSDRFLRHVTSRFSDSLYKGWCDMIVWSCDTSRQDIRERASDHEEADTRIVLHARDAAARGYKQVNILCRDTDVLVLLLAHREQLCQEIWMFAGTSRQRRYIPVHRIPLSEEKRESLLAFHAITRCDTTGQFWLWCGQGFGMESLRRCTWPLGTPCRRKPNQCWRSCQSWSLCIQTLQSGNTRGGNQQRKGSSVSQIQERSWRPTSDSRCTDSPHKAGKLSDHGMEESAGTMSFSPKAWSQRMVIQWRPSETKVNDARRSVSGVFTVNILWVLPRRRMLCKPTLHLRLTISLLFQGM